MTVKLGDSSSTSTTEEGSRKPGKRAGEEGSLEEEEEGDEGAGQAAGGEAAPNTPSSAQPTQDQHHFLRSSVRPQSKRFRKDSQAPCALAGGVGGHSASGINNNSTAVTRGKGTVPWDSCSPEDKDTFFEGLICGHGKDFEAIQNNIALKYKKKSKPASMVKNKEQVRHFYYRTWHKISKYIDFDNVFSQGLKKSSLELYGLICYGELRKKIGGCMDDKNAAKLNELIQVGATTVRYKGRNLRIKAPMCRALKKLCDPDGISDEEDQKPVRLPLKVPVELQPRNNHAWARVQSLAQNPRLRMIVELHRKVSSLIEFLKQKWALHEVRIRKTLAERQLQDSKSCEASDSYSEEKVVLHLFPGETCMLTPLPGVARVVHSKAFCTVHWQESGRYKQNAKDSHLLPPAQILGIQSGQGTARGHVKYLRGTDAKGGTRTESATDASRNTPSASDTHANAEDGSLEAGLLERASPSISVANSFGNKSPSALQDPGPSLEKPVAPVACAEGGEGPAAFPSDGTNCDCGSLPPDLEELSLLDPFPRYMKSCQDLIVPEKCLCTDRANGKDVALPRTGPPGKLPPGLSEAGSLSPTQAARGGLSASETQLPDSVTEESQEKPPPPSSSQGHLVSKTLKDDPSRLAQQVREEGWSLRTSESLTLAEVYLMMGKPNKLQLEYDWLVALGTDTPEPVSTSVQPPATGHKQKLLSCLIKLISTEVNPKPRETDSVATSPLKPTQEEHALSPPGKVVSVSTRSPGCARNQPALHKKTLSPSAPSSSSGLRNSSRPLLLADPPNSESADADRSLFAVPTTLPPNSRHGKLFLQSKEAELSFRQRLDTISMQSDFFLPKPRKLRSRHLRKPLVVQRTLLPRPSGNPSQHVCSFSILSNSSVTGRGSFRPIQSSLSKVAVSRPIVPKIFPAQASNHLSSAIDLAAKSAGIIPGSPLPVLGAEGLPGVSPLSPGSVTAMVAGQEAATAAHHQNGSPITNTGSSSECRVPFLGLTPPPEQEAITDGFQGTPGLSLPELPKASAPNGLPAPPLPPEGSGACLSPPNVSALLDISLPGPPEDVLSQGEPASQISDSIIEIAISSGQYGESVSLSPAKLNGSDSSKSLPSPSCSPQQNWIASPSHDPQWYPNDSTDSSLSSLFSSFLSPEKGRKTLPTSNGNTSSTTLLGPSLLDGNSRDSFASRSLADVAEVVDSQLACMMNENSIDYISRFNDLAQELSIPEPARREVLFDGGGGGGGSGSLSHAQ
uniref:Protein cramped-like n=1 Tax=Anolis carolinensis TaxID=28377 RepID=A0A803T6T7_ANOCA